MKISNKHTKPISVNFISYIYHLNIIGIWPLSRL